MERIRVDILDCHFPILFKIGWIATVIWMVVGIANYFGHWLEPYSLDEFGKSCLFFFTISILICYGKGVIAFISQHAYVGKRNNTRKMASFTFWASFVILLLISMWEICETPDGYRDISIKSIPFEAIYSLMCDIIIASIISFTTVLLYWFIRMCFILCSGRIRRIGVEVAITIVMLIILSGHVHESVWLNAMVVLIAAAFLYDIWYLANFKETRFSIAQLKRWILED